MGIVVTGCCRGTDGIIALNFLVFATNTEWLIHHPSQLKNQKKQHGYQDTQ
ncbi:hypothetical protein [Conchiformibius steedae]|uniref:hypothetical protein n=1 Tax=Conchiformibius steedae TaxID=153493 RepID=UPI0034E94A03